MVRHLVAVLAGLSGPALAWDALDDAGIADALTDKTVIYDGTQTTQTFYASGRTLYTASEPSWGRWVARGGQYCSQWPPSADWACYNLEREGNRVRFVGASGDITVGTYTQP